jgi:hypothetical protein
MHIIDTLTDDSGNEITTMNTSWTTKAYELGSNLHLGIHLSWNNVAVQGTLTLEYSCDPVRHDGVAVWVEKKVVTLDGTFSDLMIVDSDVPIASFRLVWARTSGDSGGLAGTYIVKKRGY